MKKYIYKGITGCIIDMINEKIIGISPIAECCDKGFFALADIEKLNITDDDTCVTYDDGYTCYQFAEIEIANVMNVENEQRLTEELVACEYAAQDLAYRMLVVDTDDHYDWMSDYTAIKQWIEEGVDYDTLDDIRSHWHSRYGWYDTSALDRDAGAILDKMLAELRDEWLSVARDDMPDVLYNILFE